MRVKVAATEVALVSPEKHTTCTVPGAETQRTCVSQATRSA